MTASLLLAKSFLRLWDSEGLTRSRNVLVVNMSETEWLELLRLTGTWTGGWSSRSVSGGGEDEPGPLGQEIR